MVFSELWPSTTTGVLYGVPGITPQPLLASLSLRNNWLLPGYWNHDRVFEGWGGAAKAEDRRAQMVVAVDTDAPG
jgi:hypothetical protein